MASRKLRSWSLVHTLIDRPLRLIEGGSAVSATSLDGEAVDCWEKLGWSWATWQGPRHRRVGRWSLGCLICQPSHLLRDFDRGACDCALVVSNDSDLRPAIELVVADGHHVGVFSPMGTVSRDLARVASWAKSIRPELLVQCQMPDEVQVPGSSRTLKRPASWK